MEPTDRRRMPWYVLVALFALLPLVYSAPPAGAAAAPRAENPHGTFKEECAHCHTSDSWKIAKVAQGFDHAKYGFPLTGAHASSQCTACHKSLDFTQAKTQCISCHQDPHRGEMGTECARCHGARSFVDRGPMVRAHQLTQFPLTGSHAAIDCESCHKGTQQGHMQFIGTQADCKGCHMPLYQSAKTPDHVAGGFPTECQTCHATLAWSPARFNHEASGFPLTGAHRAAACAQCHIGGQYRGTAKDCASCHRTDYESATPPHASAGFAASACASCHGTTAWNPASFSHANTAFPLTGSHVGAPCASCHSDGVYDGKPTACIACHAADYTAASPTHTPSSFPQTACGSCHNTTTFAGAAFDHNTTSFTLTGAHRTVTCQTCHGDGVYDGKPTACFSCHSSDYSAAVPTHTAAGFPQSACSSCHSTTAWSPASFNHANTSFPLTGAHVAAACAGCHSDGVYDGRSTACQSCHMTDYNTASPNHVAAGFSASTCATCHNTTTWAGATFNHDGSFFPIYSGKHNGKWTTCQQCHTNSNNYAVFTCLSCHPHSDRNKTDNDHSGRSGYSYDSAACYRCHPRGSA